MLLVGVGACPPVAFEEYNFNIMSFSLPSLLVDMQFQSLPVFIFGFNPLACMEISDGRCCSMLCTHVNSFPPFCVLLQTIVLDRQTVGSSLCLFPPDSSRDQSTTPSQAQVRFHSLDLLRTTSNRGHKRPCCYYDLIKNPF